MTIAKGAPSIAERQEARTRGLKWCLSCKAYQPFSDFGPSAERWDGLSPKCRVGGRLAGQKSHAKKRGDAYRPRTCDAVKAQAPQGTVWCEGHKGYCPSDTFGRDTRHNTGLQPSCRRAIAEVKNARRNPKRRATSKYKPAPDGTKWCSWHKQYESLETFGPQSTKNRADGKRSMCREGAREYSKTQNDYYRVRERGRRARKASVGGTHTAAEIETLGNKQQWLCANPVCHAYLKPTYHADHIKPLARGGSNDIRNIQLLCPPCNWTKNDQDPVEWARNIWDLVRSHELP